MVDSLSRGDTDVDAKVVAVRPKVRLEQFA